MTKYHEKSKMTGTSARMLRLISDMFEVDEAEILSNSKKQLPTNARYIAWLLLREGNMTYRQLGLDWNRDHKSVQAGVSRIRKRLLQQPELAVKAEIVRTAVLAGEELIRELGLGKFDL